MDAKSIADQARERARIALEQTRLANQEDDERKRQEEAQRQRDDYPDILRAQIVAGLNVKETGDYTQDLAAFQRTMRDLVTAVPTELVLACDPHGFASLLRDTVHMLCLKPIIPAYLRQKGEMTDDQLQPYINRVLERNLKARTYAVLLSRPAVHDRVFATCAPATINQRLVSLAGEIEKVKGLTFDHPDQYEQLCHQQWERILERIEEANHSGYIQSGGSYVMEGRRIRRRSGWARQSYSGAEVTQDECCDDPTYFLATHVTWDPTSHGEAPLIDVLKPRIAILRRWTERLDSSATTTVQAALGEYHRSGRDLFGHLINALEMFGVWSTGQCIDSWDHPLYLGELVDPLLEVLDEYAATSPASAAVILRLMAWWIGPSYGYNCPEEACGDNSKLPEFLIRLLKTDTVRGVFRNEDTPQVVATQFSRLLKEAHKHCKTVKNWSSRYVWDESLPPEPVAQLWDKHRNDDAYWDPKKQDGAQSA